MDHYIVSTQYTHMFSFIGGQLMDQHIVSDYIVSTQPNGNNCVYDSTQMGSEITGMFDGIFFF